MSRYAKGSPNSSQTGICVCGRGNPALISSSRSQVSLGDCDPPSASSSAIFAIRIPRRPGYRSTSNSTSEGFRSVADSRASIAATASFVGYQQPRSSAVLAAVVTGTPSSQRISSCSMRSPRTFIPGNGFRLVCRISNGASGSTHFAPCTALAVRPATIARRLDHSHAALARTSGVSSTCWATYTSRSNLLYRVRSALLVSSPLGTASLPTNGWPTTAASQRARWPSHHHEATIHSVTPA